MRVGDKGINVSADPHIIKLYSLLAPPILSGDMWMYSRKSTCCWRYKNRYHLLSLSLWLFCIFIFFVVISEPDHQIIYHAMQSIHLFQFNLFWVAQLHKGIPPWVSVTRYSLFTCKLAVTQRSWHFFFKTIFNPENTCKVFGSVFHRHDPLYMYKILLYSIHMYSCALKRP